jgi:hypothetical protein
VHAGLLLAVTSLLFLALIAWGGDAWLVFWRVSTGLATIGGVITLATQAKAALRSCLGDERGSKNSG